MATQIETVKTQPSCTATEKEFLARFRANGELIAASVCGVLIVLAWLFGRNDFEITSIVLYLSSFLIGGFAKAKEGIEDTIQDKELNVEMLMIFAAIGSAIIGYWAEGAMLIFIFAVSGALETYTMNKSHREISSLMDMQPEMALRFQNGVEESVHVSELLIGDLILVKPGERIPVDGEIEKGNTTVDEAAITGESIPVEKSIAHEVFAGTVNLNGVITVRITKPTHETLFQKIIEMVQSAQSEKSPSQLFIERFEGTYVKVVLAVVLVMMVAPHYMFGWNWTETFYRAMILLVVASPCALVASIMPATLSGISNGARKGILFKGGVHLEQLRNVNAIAFDKTGTLTKGKPEVTDVIVQAGYSREEFLKMTASMEQQSNHPLARSIVQYAREQIEEKLITPDHMEDLPGHGLQGIMNGENWTIGKKDFIGIDEVERFQENIASKLAEEGKTIVCVKRESELIGLIALKDQVREEAMAAIQQLRKDGVYTIMLTGDNRQTAKVIANESGVHDVMAECLPDKKVEYIKQLKEQYQSVAMVGDGINDAPALATANVGISVGEGTDVALETADVVLMKNDLSKISQSIQLSKRMNRIVKQNIIFSMSVIILLIGSNFFQAIDLPLGVIGHEGSTILVILNGLRLLR